MRSALICVFIALIIHKEGSRATSDDEFRPTPIPLNDWQHTQKDARAGTLQEIIRTDAPPTVAAVPAHYWEDALRHSVYLTLVRDKIDQLITRGTSISSDSKLNHHVSKEVDDHDLWEKIKTAPFDRLKDKEPALFGDVTIMSKGRLLEDNNGFRFAEDETSKEKCGEEKCTDGVKAYWSVKRVRQRDVEAFAGKYHYELTFSVISQSPKKLRKPHENPARTFTVRESLPVDQPKGHRIYEPISHTQRPQRAIWFHKNIAPIPHQGRKYQHGLDRIFSTLFSDEDSYEEAAPRYKQNPYVPQTFPQHSKVGYVGSLAEQHQQKKFTPYSYKAHSYKYAPSPLPPPPLTHPQHHYLDQEYHDVMNSPYQPPHTDYRFLPSNVVKTTRPAVLPTPPGTFSHIDVSMEINTKNRYNATEATKDPGIVAPYKIYSKPKPSPVKISYFTDHVRPPVYNAPPGVFVTMDKKPFKPLPPLKLLHNSRPVKSKPNDFRPSPQVLDIQFSDPDSLSDAFIPITMNYADSNTTNKSEEADSNKKEYSNNRKSKPPKKHEIVKHQRITTITPDIITAHSDSDEETDTLAWANLLGAFTKTTPMEKIAVTESTEPVTTSTSTTARTRPTSSTTTETEEIITTTLKPKKRTRPPPKYTKPEKIKKHKRVTTTTTTSTTTTTKAPEKTKVKRPSPDLTPQASSAATSSKSGWQPKSKINNTVPSTTPLYTTAKSTTTTPRPSTTTTPSSTTTSTPLTTITNEPSSTIFNRNKNRFRQSTLMNKGTSVNHDKWSATSPEKNRTLASLSSKYPPRRKGSNFHGYVPSSTPRNTDAERNKEDHIDHVNELNTNKIISTTQTTTESRREASTSTQSTYEDSADQYESNSELPSEYSLESDGDEEGESEENNEEIDEQESKDHSEYKFHESTTLSEKTNEIDTEKPSTTEKTVITTPHSTAKNKTKCNKKKLNNLTSESHKDSTSATNEIITKPTTTTTSTESTPTPDIFEDLFNGFTMDESTESTKDSQTTKPELDEGESENHEQYVQVDDDFEEFLDTLEGKGNHNDEKSEEEYEDEEDSPFDNEDENQFGREAHDDIYDDYQDRPRPYSFLELIAME